MTSHFRILMSISVFLSMLLCKPCAWAGEPTASQAFSNYPYGQTQSVAKIDLSSEELPYRIKFDTTADALADPIVAGLLPVIETSLPTIPDNEVRFQFYVRLIWIELKLKDNKGARDLAADAAERIPVNVNPNLTKEFFHLVAPLDVKDNGHRLPLQSRSQFRLAFPPEEIVIAMRRRQQAGDWDGAVAMADQLRDSEGKEMAFLYIVDTQTRVFNDFQRSMPILDAISDPLLRTNAALLLLATRTQNFVVAAP